MAVRIACAQRRADCATGDLSRPLPRTEPRCSCLRLHRDSAAVVQVIGLLRWPILVPGLADTATDAAKTAAERADAVDTFDTLNDVLGGAIGETLGYALTATWTVLIINALRERPLIGRVMTILGLSAAVLIALGVLVPLDAPGADAANFLGYILWSIWLITLGVILLRVARNRTGQPVAAAAA